MPLVRALYNMHRGLRHIEPIHWCDTSKEVSILATLQGCPIYRTKFGCPDHTCDIMFRGPPSWDPRRSQPPLSHHRR
eukprot:CAMPEP_0195046542 /NCGR_PEP_ID=MMETSP0347-20130606/26068_1 /TAXON_ID=2932 /ORGANISM="Alexandrium fundyense, Strain CCMP1719" /LENGTH=76 /DNA_ID=CAMNT_0040074575 /DNA_START=57 /DNA_END=283 /DNA_ORIENTATION=+